MVFFLKVCDDNITSKNTFVLEVVLMSMVSLKEHYVFFLLEKNYCAITSCMQCIIMLANEIELYSILFVKIQSVDLSFSTSDCN